MEKKCEYGDCELGYRYDPSKPKKERNTPCAICRPKPSPAVIPFEAPSQRALRRKSVKPS